MTGHVTMRPKEHLIHATRGYPEAWRLAEQLRAWRGHSDKFVPDWPEWCYLPMNAAYHIVRDGGGELPLAQASAIGIVGALAAWRVTQGVYRFDETIRAALAETPLAGDLPVEVFYRLPEWCVYVETPARSYDGQPLHGFFAHLDYDTDHHRTTLNLLLDTEASLISVPLHLAAGNVQASLERMYQMAREIAERRNDPAEVQRQLARARDELTRTSEQIAALLSLVIYLCSTNAEIRDAQGGAGKPSRPTPKKTRRGLREFAPDRPTTWEVAFRLGAVLRLAQWQAEGAATEEGTHASPRPHIRRAHWHSFWQGKLSQPQTRTPRRALDAADSGRRQRHGRTDSRHPQGHVAPDKAKTRHSRPGLCVLNLTARPKKVRRGAPIIVLMLSLECAPT